MLAIFPGTLFIVGFILELLQLYEIENPINLEHHLIKNIFVYFFIIFSLWVKTSNKWKSWALNSVRSQDYDDLIGKINNKKRSFVIKPWSDLVIEKKIQRVVLVIILFVGSIYWDYNRNIDEKRFRDDSLITVATINSVTKKFKKRKYVVKAKYSYTVQNKVFNDECELASGWFINIEEINGFRIEENDKFKVCYQKKHPQKNRVNFNIPCGKTENRYLLTTKQFMNYKYNDNIFSNCTVDSTYKYFGLKGIATLINQDKSYWENSNFNSIKYSLIKKSTDYKRIIESCKNN
jgi:hypothetical protein